MTQTQHHCLIYLHSHRRGKRPVAILCFRALCLCICVCENGLSHGHAQTFVILARFIQGWTAFLHVEFVFKTYV